MQSRGRSRLSHKVRVKVSMAECSNCSVDGILWAPCGMLLISGQIKDARPACDDADCGGVVAVESALRAVFAYLCARGVVVRREQSTVLLRPQCDLSAVAFVSIGSGGLVLLPEEGKWCGYSNGVVSRSSSVFVVLFIIEVSAVILSALLFST